MSLFYRHRHNFKEFYGGMDADGTLSEIWWECHCGKILDRDAKIRAAATSNLYAAIVKRKTGQHVSRLRSLQG